MQRILLLLLGSLALTGCLETANDNAAGTPAAAPAMTAPAQEINAVKWYNTAAPLTLAGLRGKVVVVEHWATWCPPCRASIPHLIELNKRFKDQGVVIIGLTDEDDAAAKVGAFVREMKMDYPVGTGSTSGSDYGVQGIPTAFVIARDGTIAWQGHPMKGLDAAIESALR
ncbi:MAG: TlpA disulfide reductase family protein [bacterium]|nr:TlpA disulfide reductase family protein [bacterium]